MSATVADGAGNGAPRAPLVSIGMPVYNGSRHIRRALDSVLAQTFTDFELIISDNASTDDTPQIIAEYAARDSRIRHFRQPHNIGIGNNWTAAARPAVGKYFKWVSSNDDYAPDLIERCLPVLERDPSVVLCHGRTQFFDGDERHHVHAGDFEILDDDPVRRWELASTRFTLGTAIQAGVIRTEALRKLGFIANTPHSDRILTSGLALTGKFAMVPEVLFYRRWNKDNATPLRKPIDIARLYHPGVQEVPPTSGMRYHAGHLCVVARAPVALRHRVRAFGKALRFAWWHKEDVFGGFAAMFRRRAR